MRVFKKEQIVKGSDEIQLRTKLCSEEHCRKDLSVTRTGMIISQLRISLVKVATISVRISLGVKPLLFLNQDIDISTLKGITFQI